jgi:hypothetical protein
MFNPKKIEEVPLAAYDVGPALQAKALKREAYEEAQGHRDNVAAKDAYTSAATPKRRRPDEDANDPSLGPAQGSGACRSPFAHGGPGDAAGPMSAKETVARVYALDAASGCQKSMVIAFGTKFSRRDLDNAWMPNLMSDHEVFGTSTITDIIGQLKKMAASGQMAASDESMAQVLYAARVRPNATVRIQRAYRRYLKRKDASGAAAGFDAGADDGLEQFAMHHVERANKEVGDLVQKYATLKRKYLDATAETYDNGGVPIANYIVQRIDHSSDLFMPAEGGLPRFRYKTVSVLLGRHPEIRVRLDMYEYAEQDYGSILPGAHSTIPFVYKNEKAGGSP